MTVLDVDEYFGSLDAKMEHFEDEKVKEIVAANFPNYEHIGRYADPMDFAQRLKVKQLVEKEFHGFSFHPLISFRMRQPKYSTEILHPNCNCFRRLKYKERPIKSCSHRDRLIYGAWNHYLTKKHKIWLEKNNLLDTVSAYVPDTGYFNADYAKKAFDYFKGKKEYSAVALDVKSFFDEIPHEDLKRNIATLTSEDGHLGQADFKLFSRVTKYSYCDKDELLANKSSLKSGHGILMLDDPSNWNFLSDRKLIRQNKKKGIPQGLACSGVLANIAMMCFDMVISEAARNLGGLYMRYADDIFIAAPSLAARKNIQGLAESALSDMNLPLAPNKTEIFDFLEGDSIHPEISYLGLVCQGNAVTVRANGVNKYREKTQRFIYSYVLTCRRRNKKASLKRIKAIFGHTGKQNYYSYLRRASRVFEADEYYRPAGIKGVLKNNNAWLERQFAAAESLPLTNSERSKNRFKLCDCPLQRDGTREL